MKNADETNTSTTRRKPRVNYTGLMTLGQTLDFIERLRIGDGEWESPGEQADEFSDAVERINTIAREDPFMTEEDQRFPGLGVPASYVHDWGEDALNDIYGTDSYKLNSLVIRDYLRGIEGEFPVGVVASHTSASTVLGRPEHE